MGIFPNLGDKTQPNLQQIRQALGSTNPNDAKSQVEAMLQSGKLSMERFNDLGRQACDIMRTLGIK